MSEYLWVAAADIFGQDHYQGAFILWKERFCGND